MVGKLDIDKSAQKPILPLHTFFSYRTSPSTVKLVGLPNKVGDWKINEVFVQYTYPDGVERSSIAKSIGNEFVATLDAPEASGTSKNGLKVVANCIDENGRHVDGFILAVGDIQILELDGEVHPGETVYTLKYLDAQPANPKKGDAYLDNGWLLIYDGQNWSEKPQIDIPTSVSQLENDVPYATQNDLDSTNQIANNAMNDASGAKDSIVQINSYLYDVIPRQASSENKLADKDFVNSSIMTNTAYFKGTFNSVAELPTDRVTPNDYAFVVGKDSAGNTTYNRYKFTADGQWMFEYTLNNSSFTAEQWATINSGITSASLDEYATLAYVNGLIGNLETIIEGI